MPVSLTVGAGGVVQEVEGKTREYKENLSSPRKVLCALVAFANSAGGQLVVGVDDDRRVVGVDDPLAEEERLANLVADSIVPRLVPTIEIVTVEGRALLVARVALSGRRPHHVKAEGPDEGVYLRLGSTNRQADLPMIRELERTALGKTFDQLPAAGQTLDSLDMEALAGMLERPVDAETLRTLTLAAPQGDDDKLVPTNGGILLAGRRREELFPFTWVQCGRFRGDDKVDIFDQAEIHSHLPLAVDEAVAFLTKNAFKSAQFGEVRRKDVWSIPVDAIREIIINAVAHAAWGA
ncbi:MAG: putative DNA binding domain-containing protein, partial [Propionibacteriaceae bacterium]|nr:putative DNA binding domain-containing protein [Propionibacteriaceae bacterium]